MFERTVGKVSVGGHFFDCLKCSLKVCMNHFFLIELSPIFPFIWCVEVFFSFEFACSMINLTTKNFTILVMDFSSSSCLDFEIFFHLCFGGICDLNVCHPLVVVTNELIISGLRPLVDIMSGSLEPPARDVTQVNVSKITLSRL